MDWNKSFIFTACICLFLSSASYSYADIYQWTDKDGVVHITTEYEKVPEAYRDAVKTFKPTKRQETPASDGALRQEDRQKGPELYGDETLEWWAVHFKKKRLDISNLGNSIAGKRGFIDIFENGRRVGQLFEPKDVDKYNQYKAEIPGDEARLKDMKDDLDEFIRKAKIHGVPKSVYGE